MKNKFAEAITPFSGPSTCHRSGRFGLRHFFGLQLPPSRTLFLPAGSPTPGALLIYLHWPLVKISSPVSDLNPPLPLSHASRFFQSGSNCSMASEATSDDPPDLRAFTDVFHALNEFQHKPCLVIATRIPITKLDHSYHTPTSSTSLVALSPITKSNTTCGSRSFFPVKFLARQTTA